MNFLQKGRIYRCSFGGGGRVDVKRLFLRVTIWTCLCCRLFHVLHTDVRKAVFFHAQFVRRPDRHVYDPFAGVRTTIVHRHGNRLIVLEIDNIQLCSERKFSACGR